MSWGNVLKFDLDETVNSILERLKTTTEHPNYNRDDLLMYVEEGEDIKMLSSFLRDLEQDTTPDWKIYHYRHGGSVFQSMLNEINNSNIRYYRSIAQQRSMEWLEDFAKTFGVQLINPRPTRVEFTHEGLRYIMGNRSLLRIYPQSKKQRVSVCIVDDNDLPVGDFYAQLMALIVTRPEELDVLDFAIKITKLMGRHDVPELNHGSIEVYTPFTMENNENFLFDSLIVDLKSGGKEANTQYGDSYISALEDIEMLLIECFGDTRGWNFDLD